MAFMFDGFTLRTFAMHDYSPLVAHDWFHLTLSAMPVHEHTQIQRNLLYKHAKMCLVTEIGESETKVLGSLPTIPELSQAERQSLPAVRFCT